MFLRRISITIALLISVRAGLSTAQDSAPYNPKIAAASNEGERALDGFRLPEGMVGSLFAAEPMLANPVAFAIDEKGRVFVAETFRQKQGVEDNRSHMNWLHDDLALQTVEQRVEMFRKYLGEKVYEYTAHHDRIRLLEDSDGDGKADKSTVFADGFNEIEDGTGAGLLARNGDVFYTCIPKLWKLRDEDGDGVADQRDALHQGYGVRVAFRGHDMHGLIMGPDGRVYFSIGDRGYNVETKEGTQLVRPDTGAVFRCEPDGTGLEVFAYGLRNPQELAFDDYGNLFTGDNNSDSGDKARWVYVVEGGDTGWRMYYQYLNDRGPWNREKLWHPQHEGQAAYIIPPIANLGDGPSGLVHYPGVGLPERYKDHFFLCDFRGGPSNSGIRSFAVKPKGASFELVDSHEFIWKILGTDIDFGYDGGIYISDWVNGWDGLGKGRIYKFWNSEAAKSPALAQPIMSKGFAERSNKELVALLSHPDRRVRQDSQFALVKNGALDELTEAAMSAPNQLARIHAIWGLGQIMRSGSQTRDIFHRLHDDSDTAVRIQVARVLGDSESSMGFAILLVLLSDGDVRVSSQAAISLSKHELAEPINKKHTVFQELRKLLQRTADKEPVARHAASLALSKLMPSKLLAEELAIKSNLSSIRRGMVIALRQQKSKEIGDALGDLEPSIVLEAARGIHDEGIVEALPQLAALADQPMPSGNDGLTDALVRRVMNANFRLGQKEHAERVIKFATNVSLPESLRVEALEELKMWDAPSPIDRVLGAWRPIAEKRDASFMTVLLRPQLGGIISGSEKVQKLGAELAAKYGIQEVEPVLVAVAGDSTRATASRVAAIKALDTLDSKSIADVAQASLKDDSPDVRVAAREIVVRRNPDAASKILAQAILDGTTIEQQAAIAQLAELKRADADTVLTEWLNVLVEGNAPAAIHLDLLEAAKARGTESLLKLVAAFEQRLDPADPLSKYRVALEGGNAKTGADIFFGRSSASCRRCHSVQNSGGAVGPDLSIIGKEKNREYLLEAIVAPNAKIAKGFEPVIAVMDSGKVYAGTKRTDDGTTLELMLADGTVISLPKDEIDELAKGQSAMPADLIKHLSLADLRDLVEYLAQQQTPAPKVTGHE
ncbi:MAG: HEAT repeat domain-containing protein [Planctomycetota bacterium]|nr:HEAT repeat domain-containing protein [Planctomycetota bacterium]MDA0918714.1 HEAT repeat domain-containing protein [Planctomycetota bacterium]MDA1160303.1 HEAT repeat domain-containing protein [Planctomycetota bacterium]